MGAGIGLKNCFWVYSWLLFSEFCSFSARSCSFEFLLWLLLGCDNKGLLITLHLNKKFPPGWMDWSANIWSLVPSTDQLKQGQHQLSGQLGPGVAITKFKNGYISFVYFPHHHNGNKRISSNHEQTTYESWDGICK